MQEKGVSASDFKQIRFAFWSILTNRRENDGYECGDLEGRLMS